jgi:hypothetical protein
MPDDHDDPTTDEDGPVIRKLRAQLREFERRDAEAQAATAELAKLRRERVFDKAGIPDEGPAKWFRSSFQAPDGEELTVEMVRAAAQADGIVPGPAPEGGAEGQRAISNISAVAGGSPAPTPNLLNEIAAAESEDALMQILSRENLLSDF